ncbi:MAG: DUF4230 domain-containing protein [Lactobacillus sp.]|nr:DUF4230 domain-containing protein [Lactobacillus sp.]
MNRVFTIKNICCVILLLLVFVLIFFFFDLEDLGKDIGQNVGKSVGIALGSYKGITEGLSDGAKAGKEKGLSAEDTNVSIKNSIEKIGKFDVLVSGVRLTDVHSYSDKYSSIYLIKGSVTFSVDLSMADVNIEDNDIKVTLPEPEGNLYTDNNAIEKIDEWEKNFLMEVLKMDIWLI